MYLNDLNELVKKFIDENKQNHDRWKNTPMEDYHLLSQKKKGDLGELIVQEYMKKGRHIVRPADCGYNGPYDRNIDNYKTEIKFSLSQKNDDNIFIINHVKEDMEWDRFIFYGWNLLKPHIIVWCTKEDMKKCREETKLWAPQSSEKEFMCGSPYKWINSPYVRDIETWNDEVIPYEGLQEFMNDVVE